MKPFKLNVYDSVRHPKQNQQVDLWEIIHWISEGEFKGNSYLPIIDNINSLTKEEILNDKGIVNRIKSQLPLFVSAVNCGERNGESILSYTGLMTLDIDFDFRVYNQEELEKIKQSIFYSEKHILCAFLSPSKGIKLIVYVGDQCNSQECYSDLFNSIASYYKYKHGIDIDKSGRDAVRACYFSYDPNILSRHDVESFTPDSSIYRINNEIQHSEKYQSVLSRSNTSPTQIPIVHNLISEYRKRIADLVDLDNRGLISSKHGEMLKIQLNAISAINQHGLDESEVFTELYQEWCKIYPSNPSKMNSFKTAWEGATKLSNRDNLFDIDIEGTMFSSDSGKFNYQRYLKVKQRKQEEVLLTLQADSNDITFLARSNVSCLVALPGSGKTSIVESLCSKLIEPLCEGIHFGLGSSVKKILLIDTENSDYDLAIMIDRISKRTTLEVTDILSSDKLTVISTIEMEIEQDRKIDVLELISNELEKKDYDIVIVDDVSALVSFSNEGVNSISGSTYVINNLNKLSRKHDCGFLLTIHANSQRSTGKARGWLGSEIERYSMSVLHLIRDVSTFIISAGSESAKLRRGGLATLNNSPLYYHYNDMKGYMCQVDEDDLESIPSSMQSVLRNKSICKAIEDYIDSHWTENSPFLKQTVIDHISTIYPDLSTNVIDKQFAIWKKKTIKYKTGKEGKFCTIVKL
jgi:aspartate carbamoyltransferase regulatory subunit